MTKLYCREGHETDANGVWHSRYPCESYKMRWCRTCMRSHMEIDCTESPRQEKQFIEKKGDTFHYVAGGVKECEHDYETIYAGITMPEGYTKPGSPYLKCKKCPATKPFEAHKQHMEWSKDYIDFIKNIPKNIPMPDTSKSQAQIAVDRVIEALASVNNEFSSIGYRDRGLFLLEEKLKEINQ